MFMWWYGENESEKWGIFAVEVMANFEYSGQGRPHQECDIWQRPRKDEGMNQVALWETIAGTRKKHMQSPRQECVQLVKVTMMTAVVNWAELLWQAIV